MDRIDIARAADRYAHEAGMLAGQIAYRKAVADEHHAAGLYEDAAKHWHVANQYEAELASIEAERLRECAQ